MDRPPSSCGFTMVSKKGMEPFSLLSSTVNLMAGSTLNVLKEVFSVDFLVDDKGVIYKAAPEPRGGVGCSAYGFLL